MESQNKINIDARPEFSLNLSIKKNLNCDTISFSQSIFCTASFSHIQRIQRENVKQF